MTNNMQMCYKMRSTTRTTQLWSFHFQLMIKETDLQSRVIGPSYSYITTTTHLEITAKGRY